jgi:hypothetical protein
MCKTLVAALSALLLSSASQAGPVEGALSDHTVRLSGFSNGYAAVDVSTDPWGTIGAGRFSGTLDGASFLTYCTDLAQSFNWNTSYTYTLVANGSAHGFTSLQADLLGKLYTRAGEVQNTDQSAAFQLSVWEIMNEASPASVTEGNFRLLTGASSQQRNLANTWLAEINQANAARSFDALRLYSSVAQDFVIFTAVPPELTINRVPEPGSIALVGLALAGLVATRQRQR